MSSQQLIIAPRPLRPTSYTATSSFSAPSAPGVYDTLRARQLPSTVTAAADPSNEPHAQQQQLQLKSSHPLESRLAQWEGTQTNLKHALLRQQFGLAAPMQRQFQLLAVRCEDSVRPSVLDGVYGCYGGRSVHYDILTGRDCELDWNDVFVGGELDPLPDVHAEMEYRMGLKW